MGPYQKRRLDPARRTRRLREGFNPKQRRHPKGSPKGGQFAPAKGGGGAGLSGIIQSARPDWGDHEIETMLEVMALDAERFDHYNEKLGLGLTAGDRDAFFKDRREQARREAQERWDRESAHTLTGPTGKIYHQSIGPRLEHVVGRQVGGSAQAAADELVARYGVGVDFSRSVKPHDAIHAELSDLVNLAGANPVVAGLLKNEISSINYAPRAGSAAAEWTHPLRPGGKGRLLVGDAGDTPLPPSVWTHELGHAAANRYGKGDAFGESWDGGNRVSMYAWRNSDENYAETFSAMAGGQDPATLRAFVPAEFGHIESTVPGMREWLGGDQ